MGAICVKETLTVGEALTPRSKDTVKSVMAYLPSAVAQFYIARPTEVSGER